MAKRGNVGEVIPELLSLVTDPRYDPAAFVGTGVPEAGARLLQEIGAGEAAPVVEPAARTLAQLAEALDPATATHDEVTALGGKVLDEARTRFAPIEADREAKLARRGKVEADYSGLQDSVWKTHSAQVKAGEPVVETPEVKAKLAEMERLQPTIEALNNEIRNAPKFNDTLKGVLAEVRPMGGAPEVSGRKTISQGVQTLADRFPRDWIDRWNLNGQVKLSERTGVRGYHSWSSQGGETKQMENGTILRKVVEAGITTNKDEAALADPDGTLLHEMMHRFQATVPNLQRLERDYFDARTEGEATVPLYGRMRSKEVGKADEWRRVYTGRQYGTPRDPLRPFVIDEQGTWYPETPVPGDGPLEGGAWPVRTPMEVITTGVEDAYGGVADEIGHAAFVVGLLAGV
jgi:hypothetical protein